MTDRIRHLASRQQDRANQELLRSVLRFSSTKLRTVARDRFRSTDEGKALEQAFKADDAEERMPELVKRAVALAESDPFYRLERFCQRHVAEEFMVRNVVFSEAERGSVLERRDGPREGAGGSYTLVPDFKTPSYFDGVPWHLQADGLDGYDLYGAPQAGPAVSVFDVGGFAAVPPGSNIFRDRMSVAEELPKEVYQRILEIGCGPGVTLRCVNKVYPDAELIGVDLSENMIRKGHDLLERSGVKAELRQEDCRSINEPDNSVDAVVSYAVHHEAPYAVNIEMFQEVLRVLKPGGDFVIHDPPPFRAVEPFHAALLDWETEHRGEPYFREVALSNWEKELSKIGFDNAEAYPLGEGSYPWITRASKPLATNHQ